MHQNPASPAPAGHQDQRTAAPHLDGLHRYEDGPLVLAQRWRYLSFALSEDPGDTALALRLVNDLGKFICARQEQGVNQVEDCRSNG